MQSRREPRSASSRPSAGPKATPIIAASTPSSLRAQRSNPEATARGPWIASSQGLLAMTDGVIHVPEVDFLNSGCLLSGGAGDLRRFAAGRAAIVVFRDAASVGNVAEMPARAQPDGGPPTT